MVGFAADPGATSPTPRWIVAILLLWAVLSRAQEEEEVFFPPGQNTRCELGPNKLTSVATRMLGYERAVPQTCMEVNGIQRCFYTYVPDCAHEQRRVPLVYNLHAANGCVESMFRHAGWWQKADRYCFVVVYPMGNTNPDVTDFPCWGIPGGNPFHFNHTSTTSNPCCCRHNNVKIGSVGDDEFLLRIAPTVAKDLRGKVRIDRRRIYMTGQSNGCMMSLAMAAWYPDFVTAVCCHAGTMVEPFPHHSNRQLDSPVPTWMIHGKLDEVVNPDGSAVQLGPIQSAQRIAESLRHHCAKFQVVETSDATQHLYSECRQDANVSLILLDNVGHNPHYLFPPKDLNPGVKVPSVDSTEWAWQFCSSYERPRSSATSSSLKRRCVDTKSNKFWYKGRYRSCRWLAGLMQHKRSIICSDKTALVKARSICPATCGSCLS